MVRYYQRDGTPYPWPDGEMAWSQDFASAAKREVAEDTLPNGKWISTVWVGMAFGKEPPLIFETIVFSQREGGEELDAARYSTEEQALAGHRAMVEKWRGPFGS